MRRPLRRRAGTGDARRGRGPGLRRRCRPGAGAVLSGTGAAEADPFGTAALRAAVLDSWAGSPTRFREDANAEEDLRLGGYADAWFAELAQNAADAARSGGVPGRLRVTVAGAELRVANTGAALDAAGVAAFASLRASAKRDSPETVGRFGVGFAAVLALTDAPRVVSAGGGVRFSATDTAAAVSALAGPAAELGRRAGQLPVLRLVWPVEPAEPAVPAGFATEVRLPLRAGAGAEGTALLDAARAAATDLLLALPDLVEITVDDTVVTRREREAPMPGCSGNVVTIEGGEPGPRSWLLARRAGGVDEVAAGMLAVEQRARRDWSVTWALPLDADGYPAPLREDVLHAPTATGEAVALPARLIATLPLEPDRRRVRPGPVTDRLLDEAGTTYLDLVRAVPPADRLALVPESGFPRSALDGRLRDGLLAMLRAASWLPAAAGGELTPGRAEWLDVPGAALPTLLAEAGRAFEGLLAAGPPPPAALGVRRLGSAELADRLLGLRRPDGWWRAVYAALELAADTVPGLLGELRALPVPLADGPDPGAEVPHGASQHGGFTAVRRQQSHHAGVGGGRARVGDAPRAGRSVAGPASVLLPAGSGEPAARIAALGLPGLHLARPGAVHPLLTRLGAADADTAGLLDHPALREAVERSVDESEAGLDQGALAGAVLGLLTELGPGAAAARPWLAALALPDVDSRPTRADELLLPDAALRPVLAPDAPLGVLAAEVATAAPRDVLTGLGVLDGFAVVVDEDAVGPDHDLDDEDGWWDARAGDAPVRFVAVRDLDLVDDAAWPAALYLLGAEPATRAAVLDAAGYTAWWLARHARIAGRRPGHWRLPSAGGLAALHDPAPVEPGTAHDGGAPDEALLAAIGVRADLHVSGPADAADLLVRLADPARYPDAALTATAHAALAEAVLAGRVDPADLDAPDKVRALDATVVAVDDAVVLDAPWLAAVLPAAELVVGGDARALADLLDLPLASEVVGAEVEGKGRPVRWSELPEVVVACHTLGVDLPSGEVRCHDPLTVVLPGDGAERRTVPAWRDAAGRWHASDPVRALLAVLADREVDR